MDPLDTETSRFWENFGPQNPSDPASIQTEVFQLPTTCFAEEDGALVNSARWLQWHWKAANPPGDAQQDAQSKSSAHPARQKSSAHNPVLAIWNRARQVGD